MWGCSSRMVRYLRCGGGTLVTDCWWWMFVETDFLDVDVPHIHNAYVYNLCIYIYIYVWVPRHSHRSIDQHNRFIPRHQGNLTVQPVFLYQKLHIAKALRCPVTRTIEAKPLLSSGELSLHNCYGIVVVLYGFHYLWFHGILSSRSNFNILQLDLKQRHWLHMFAFRHWEPNLSPSFKVTLIQDTLYQTKWAPHKIPGLGGVCFFWGARPDTTLQLFSLAVRIKVVEFKGGTTLKADCLGTQTGLFLVQLGCPGPMAEWSLLAMPKAFRDVSILWDFLSYLRSSKMCDQFSQILGYRWIAPS